MARRSILSRWQGWPAPSGQDCTAWSSSSAAHFRHCCSTGGASWRDWRRRRHRRRRNWSPCWHQLKSMRYLCRSGMAAYVITAGQQTARKGMDGRPGTTPPAPPRRDLCSGGQCPSRRQALDKRRSGEVSCLATSLAPCRVQSIRLKEMQDSHVAREHQEYTAKNMRKGA